MLTQQRKIHILSLLKRDGRIVAKEISEALGLSEDTIRRDLRDLASEGLLLRVHGGALPASPPLVRLADRDPASPDGKMAIGRAGARMISSGQIVFVDGGTTTLCLVRCLAPELSATIVTHSPTIAVALADHPSVDVVIIGGTLFKHSIVATGSSTTQAIADIKADLYFMGVTGIHPDLGATTTHFEEAAVKRMMCRSAAETVVLASADKIGKASPYLIVPTEMISTMVVENDARAEMAETFARTKVDIRGA